MTRKNDRTIDVTQDAADHSDHCVCDRCFQRYIDILRVQIISLKIGG